VKLTHGSVVAAATHINATLGNGDGDVEVVPLPLSHSFGLGRLRCNLLSGGALVLTQGFKLPGEIFGALKRHGATGLAGVPAGFAVLLRFGERGLGAFADRLRYVEIGSAAMRLEQKRELMRLLPRTRLFMHYGLTEASRSAFIEFHRDSEHLETVGRPAPGVEMQVRDEHGEQCPAGTRGTLWIRGGHVARGYWNNPERSAAVFVDGWVCTDDAAEFGTDGFLALHGRQDDMINVGGFNVWPEEVERVLEAHSAVAEAGCVGVSDPRGIAGQIIRAHLILAGGRPRALDEELRAWTATRLEPYKVPLEFEWVESLPRTTSGKLQRGALRARSEQRPKADD
jgi:long-chain acyl-CoA synthetase